MRHPTPTPVTDPEPGLAWVCRLLRGDGIPGEVPAGDWPQVTTMAMVHRVAPFLHHGLRTRGQQADVPAATWHAWTLEARRSMARNALYLATLETVVDTLNRVGIEPVLLKGADLCLSVYPHPGLRPMGDLDLWVLPEMFETALAALQTTGLRVLDDRALRRVRAGGPTNQVALAVPSGFPAYLELHVTPLRVPKELRNLSAERAIWERTQLRRVGRAQARVPEAADRVVYLMAHLARHAAVLDRLLWYLDVDRVLRRTRVDWSAVLERARAQHMTPPLVWGLPLLQHRLGSPIPAWVMAQLPRLPQDPLARGLYLPPDADAGRARLVRGWQDLREQPTMGAQIRWILEHLAPPPPMPDGGPRPWPHRAVRHWARLAGKLPGLWQALRSAPGR